MRWFFGCTLPVVYCKSILETLSHSHVTHIRYGVTPGKAWVMLLRHSDAEAAQSTQSPTRMASKFILTVTFSDNSEEEMHGMSLLNCPAFEKKQKNFCCSRFPSRWTSVIPKTFPKTILFHSIHITFTVWPKENQWIPTIQRPSSGLTRRTLLNDDLRSEPRCWHDGRLDSKKSERDKISQKLHLIQLKHSKCY